MSVHVVLMKGVTLGLDLYLILQALAECLWGLTGIENTLYSVVT